ncbi:MAG: hypothetical protein R3F49_09685 [Planctomycetota bacterium]
MDARLTGDDWPGRLGPRAVAVMALLALAADEFGAWLCLRETLA